MNKETAYSSLSNLQIELKRVVFKAFGVTSLEGLSIFEKFKDRYVLMRKDSCLASYILGYQKNQIILFQNEVVFNLGKENQNQFAQHDQLLNFVTKQYQKQTKDLESNQDILTKQLAFICDLNCEFMMVPREWIEDIIKTQTLHFCYASLNIVFQYSALTSQTQAAYLNAIQNVKSLSIKIGSPILHKISEIEAGNQNYRKSIRTALHSLVQVGLTYPLGTTLTYVKQQAMNDLNKMKTYFASSNKKILATDQSITLPPNDKHRVTPLSPQIRSSLLDLCFDQLRQAMSKLGKAEEFYSQIIKAFNGFAFIDEYPYFLEVISKQRKLLKSQLPKIPSKVLTQIEEKDQQLKNVYLLLDAHVYLKCNAWTQAVDSIYSFLNATVQKLNFHQILDLIESAFYRIVFNYYIYRTKKEQGVIIPDYAMIYLEPNSNYNPSPQNQQKTHSVPNVEYHKIILQLVPDLKLISEAFYWSQLLVEALNRDEDSILNASLYYRVYNMIIVLLLNSSKQELSQQATLCQRIASLAKDLHESPFEGKFKECGQMRDKSNIPKQADWAKDRNIQLLYKLLKYDNAKDSKQSSSGFVKLYSLGSSTYDKSMTKMFDAIITKAYYQEQALLAKHMAASNYICRIFRQQRLLKVPKENQHIQDHKQKALIEKYRHSFEVLERIEVNALESKIKIETSSYHCALTFEKYDRIITQIIQMLQSKLVVYSLDLHYIKQKFKLLSDQQKAFEEQIKSIFFDYKHKNIAETLSQVDSLAESERDKLVQEGQALKEWMNKKADLNLIEFEKKTLNMRSKWENLIQFSKKKKIMIRHLQKKMKK